MVTLRQATRLVPAPRPCIVSGRACLCRLPCKRRLRFSSTLEKRAGGLSKAQASDTKSGLAADRPSPEHGALCPMPLYHKSNIQAAEVCFLRPRRLFPQVVQRCQRFFEIRSEEHTSE